MFRTAVVDAVVVLRGEGQKGVSKANAEKSSIESQTCWHEC